MKFSKTKLALAFAGLALFGAQAASAAPPQTGDTVKVLDTAGRLGSGGPFLVTGGTYAGGSFETFCIETTEFLSLGSTYTVTMNTGAVNGGNGYAAKYGGDVTGTATFDPLSKASGWLYSQYLTGGGGLTGWTGSATDRADLQVSIWYLEDEVAAAGGNAGTWVTQAIAAAPAYVWDVGVMNLTDSSGGLHQDLLAPIPEPETYAMLLAGLGLMGFVVRRRQRKLAAA